MIFKEGNSVKFLKHFVAFYIIWGITETVIYPFLRAKDAFLCDLYSPVWKIIIWLVPVAYILLHEKYSILHYLKLGYINSRTVFWSISGAGFMAGYNVVMHMAFYESTTFYPYLEITQLVNTVLIAGFVEEVLFRGYFLQRIRECFSFWQSNFLVSLMFLSIHFPIWYVNADHIAHGMVAWLQLTVFIFCFSLLQGLILRKAGSLWPCIILHMMNNFMALALIR